MKKEGPHSSLKEILQKGWRESPGEWGRGNSCGWGEKETKRKKAQKERRRCSERINYLNCAMG